METAFYTASPALDVLSALVSQRLAPAAVPGERWPELLELAAEHRLTLMLCWVVEQAGFALPDQAVDRKLRNTLAGETIYALRLRAAQRRLQSRFAAAGVPALWLKGIALANTVYPLPALRPMGDLDVLVPPAQLGPASDAARQAGCRAEPASTTKLIVPDDLMHHRIFLSPDDPPLALEIHTRLLGVGGKNSLLPLEQLRWFWQQDQITRTADDFAVPRPEAHFLYLCAHAILQHSEEDLRLIRIFDLHRLISVGSLDWHEIVERAAVLRWSLAVEQGLVLAERSFGTELPGWVLPQLRQSAQQLGAINPLFKPNRIATAWGRVNRMAAQLTPRQRLVMFRALLLPSSAYIRTRYNLDRQSRLWPYYLRHWLCHARIVAQTTLLRLKRS